MAPVVEALQAMRGVGLIVAVTVVAEVGDFSRSPIPASSWPTWGWCHRSARAAAASAAAASPRLANAHARRVLIEGAWTYRMQARVSRKLLDRLEHLPQAIRNIAWRAQLRLCHRYRRLAAAG
jgi:transposase